MSKASVVSGKYKKKEKKDIFLVEKDEKKETGHRPNF
jgi:hypothetical protein